MPANATAGSIAIVRHVVAQATFGFARSDAYAFLSEIPSEGTLLTLPDQAGDGDAYEWRDADGSCSGSHIVTVQGFTDEQTVGGADSVEYVTAFSWARFVFDAHASNWTIASPTAGEPGESLLVVPNAAALTAAPLVGLTAGAMAFCGAPGAPVPSFCAYFSLTSSAGLAADGVTVIASSSAGFVWVRTLSAVEQASAAQDAWFVDRVEGDDENTGLTSETALNSKAEIARRWGTWSPRLDGIAVTNMYLSPDDGSGNDPGLFAPIFLNGASLTHTSPLPAAGFTGTLLAVTAKNRATPTALRSTFTTTTGALAAGMLLVNTDRGNSRAFLQRNVGAGVWQISQPYTPYVAPTQWAATEVDSWADGDAIVGYVLNAIDLALIGGVTVDYSLVNSSHVVTQLRIEDPAGSDEDDPLQVDGRVYFVLSEVYLERSISLQGANSFANIIANVMTDPSSVVNLISPDFGLLEVAGGVLSGFLNLVGVALEGDIILASAAAFPAKDCSVFDFAYLEQSNFVAQGVLAMGTGILYGSNVLNMRQGVCRYSNTAVSTFIGVTLEVNGIGAAYSRVTAAGVTTVHGGIALTAAALDGAAGAAGFGGFAEGGGAFFARNGAQP